MDFSFSYNANILSDKDLGDCGTPDSKDSPGAKFLLSVQDSVNDIISDTESIADLKRFVDNDERGRIHEEADSAVPVYTHERWQVFVDLCAYQEDISEFGDPAGDSDLTNTVAGVALYVIAQRLIYALLNHALEDHKAELSNLPAVGTKGFWNDGTIDGDGYPAEVTDTDPEDDRLPLYLKISYPDHSPASSGPTASHDEEDWVALDEFKAAVTADATQS